MNILRKPPKYG